MRSIAHAFALILGPLCAAAAGSAGALERAAPPRDTNPAVLGLLESAERELNAGQPQQASTLLERALAIEPRNPAVWHYLGVAHLDLGNYTQAEAMAAKAHSLGGNDRALRVSNAELMATALQSSGRAPTNAERQVLAGPSTFDRGVERARRYIDRGWGEPRDEAKLERSWSLPESARQTWRDAQSASWRQAQAAAQRAQSAARRAEAAARRAEEAYRRYYRDTNEGVRRRRY